MKKTLLLTTALATGLFATAQTQHGNHFRIKQKDSKHTNFINSLLQTNSTATANKPTGTAQRVIAQVYNETDYTDSTHFKYTGTKGSRYEHNTVNYVYNIAYGSNYAPLISTVFMNNPLEMLADSIISFEDNALYYNARGYYRTDNKLDSFSTTYFDATNPPYTQRTLHSFYPGGYLKEIINLYNDGTTTDTSQLRKLSYNTAYDKIATDTLFMDFGGSSIEPVTSVKYHYNTQGNADTITTYYYNGSDFYAAEKAIISYTTDEKIQKIQTFNIAPNSSQLLIAQTDTFAYANSSDYFTFWENKYFDEGGLVQGGNRMTKYAGSNGFPDSVAMYSLNNDIWSEDITLHYTYNSFDNPQTLTASIDGEPEEGMVTFYYEEYDDGLSIKPVAENKDFTVYPNPFSSNINIDWKGKQQSNVTVKLINIVGQDVFKSSMKLNAGQNNITLPALNSGNYILLLQDANGKSWSSKMVKR